MNPKPFASLNHLTVPLLIFTSSISNQPELTRLRKRVTKIKEGIDCHCEAPGRREEGVLKLHCLIVLPDHYSATAPSLVASRGDPPHCRRHARRSCNPELNPASSAARVTDRPRSSDFFARSRRMASSSSSGVSPACCRKSRTRCRSLTLAS